MISFIELSNNDANQQQKPLLAPTTQNLQRKANKDKKENTSQANGEGSGRKSKTNKKTFKSSASQQDVLE